MNDITEGAMFNILSKLVGTGAKIQWCYFDDPNAWTLPILIQQSNIVTALGDKSVLQIRIIINT